MLWAEPFLLVYPLHRARGSGDRAADRQPGAVPEDRDAVFLTRTGAAVR